MKRIVLNVIFDNVAGYPTPKTSFNAGMSDPVVPKSFNNGAIARYAFCPMMVLPAKQYPYVCLCLSRVKRPSLPGALQFTSRGNILDPSSSRTDSSCDLIRLSAATHRAGFVGISLQYPEISVRFIPLRVVGDAAHLSDCDLRHAEAWLGARAPDTVDIIERR